MLTGAHSTGAKNCADRAGAHSASADPAGADSTNPVTRVSDIIGWRLDLIINKLTPPACAAQHVYYCGNRNG